MRILIITYYWPPSGGGGVQRWLKLSRYLLDEGIHPIIYTPQLKHYPYRDDSLLKEVDPRIEVWSRPIWEPYAALKWLLGTKRSASMLRQEAFEPQHLGLLQRISLWVRANFFVPDPRISWLCPSLSFLCRRLRLEPVDLVLSTGPPHSMHLIGMGLKKRLGLRYWADFRDEWTTWDVLLSMRPGALTWALHRRLERAVLKNCDKLLTVSNHWAKAFQAAGATDTLTLYNGYDEEDISRNLGTSASKNRTHSRVKESKSRTKRFQLLHLGQMSLSRSEGFWRAFSEICSDQTPLGRSIEVLLGGQIDPSLDALLKANSWLRNRVHFCGYVPHEQIFEYYQHASVLLLFARPSPQVEGQIPGKLFEYLGSQRPILYMGAANGEAAELIQAQKAGLSIEQHDTAGIKTALEHLYHSPPSNYQDPSRFSRQHQAKELAKAIRSECRTKKRKED